MTALRWVLRLGRTGRGRLALAILLGALASGAAIGLTATSAWLISRASQHPPVLHLMVAIVAVRAFGLARGVLRYGERLTGHDASFRTLGDLRVATVARLEQVLPIRGDAERTALGAGDLLSRAVHDIDSLQDLWVRVVLPYSAAALVGAAAVVLVGVLVPAAGVALAVSLLAAALLAPAVSARAGRHAETRLAPLRAEYRTAVLDLLDGATELAVYGAMPARLEELDRCDTAMTTAEARSATASGYGAALATLAAGAAVWAGLWFGTDAVRTGALSAVSLAIVVLVPIAVHEVFAGLAPAAHQLPALATAAQRVRDIFQQPPSAQEPTTPKSLPTAPFGLRVRDLHARWLLDGPDVLRGVDVEIAPGSQTLIVGPSGSGKSTLAAVLLRLLDPTAGTVELTGSDHAIGIDQLAGDDVRGVIGWCAQDAYIFDSTIEANLRLARPEASAAELADALRRARLDSWIASLPGGLQTMVGEHGGHLSGGQRQRLALARTLLAGRPIMIFDEPTEHLDEATAVELADDILHATGDATVIIVTHRPELFPTVTTTLRLEQGSLCRAATDDGSR